MDKVSRKTGFRLDFFYDDVQIKISILFVSKKTINTYLKAEILYTQHEFQALSTYLSYFSKKADAKIYIYH